MALTLAVGSVSFEPAFAHNDGQLSPPTSKPDVGDNPVLDAACGLDVNLVLDESGSINSAGAVPDVRAAANAFVGALADTGSQVAIVEFGSQANRVYDYTPVTSGAGGTVATLFEPYINDTGGSPSGDVYDSPSQTGGWTNWDDALDEVWQINGTTAVAPLVVFVTDGDPTAFNRDYSGEDNGVTTNAGSNPQSLWRAMEEANAVKQQGSKILVVGVGNGLQNAASQQRLQDVSGTEVVTDPANLNLATNDVLLIQNFADLEEALREVAFQLCSPAVTFTKKVDGNVAEGWEFVGSVESPIPNGTNYFWLSPDDTANPGDTVSATTDENGTVVFQWEPDNPVDSTLTFNEVLQADFEFVDASCLRKTLTSEGIDETFFDPGDVTLATTITVGPNDIITCEVNNTEQLEATIEVVKVVDPSTDPGLFNLLIDGNVEATDAPGSAPGNSTGAVTVSAGTTASPGADHTVSETAGTGNDLALYGTEIFCAGPEGASVGPIEGTSVNVPVDPNDEWLCTITNTLLEGPPAITVVKRAGDAADGDTYFINEPGGTVTFSVSIRNDSDATDPVTLTSLTDDIYGDLTDDAGNDLISNSECELATIVPDGTYECTFDGTFFGNAGASQTDVVTAEGADNEGTPVSGNDDAVVEIADVQPNVAVGKVANPTSVPESGADVTFTVTLTNNATEDASIDSLVDDIYGNLSVKGDCGTLIGTTLAANGGTASCSFTEFVAGDFPGSETDTVTGTVSDDEGNEASDTGSATVTYDDVQPNVAVGKVANPTSVPESGADVTFTVTLTNNATEDASIDSLVDDIYGNLSVKGDCGTLIGTTLAANGGTASCSFTEFVAGDFPGSETDTVTGTVSDDDGNTDSDDGSATVTFEDVQPDIEVTKTADQTLVVDGDSVTFSIEVRNLSAEAATLDSLEDSVYGDLNGQGDCSVPQNLAPTGETDDTYSCSFSVTVTGDPVVIIDETDVVTAVASDDDGNSDTATDDETIKILPAGRPSIDVFYTDATLFQGEGTILNGTFRIDNVSDSFVEVLWTNATITVEHGKGNNMTTIDAVTCTYSGASSGAQITLPFVIGAANDPQTVDFSCTMAGSVPSSSKKVISRVVIDIANRDKDFQDTNQRL